ncbi:hypothetical protein Ciccas_006011 [Cichlidogyrus casuarinus]|uniref:protein-tyrosine-phosphatase n=1 Tax=Cichlidogyrus casuarinus TaxID=1844966 RepID=A0ABD2Q7I9_9PLAT
MPLGATLVHTFSIGFCSTACFAALASLKYSIKPYSVSAVEALRPHISPMLPRRKIVKPGSQLELVCRALGQPAPSIKWFSDETSLSSNSSANSPDGQSNEALLRLFDLDQSVNITCVAESNLGAVSHTIHVLVKNLPNAPRSLLLSSVQAHSAQLVFLPAERAPNTDPVSHYLVEVVMHADLDAQLIQALPDDRLLADNRLSMDEYEHLLKSNGDRSKTMFKIVTNATQSIPADSLLRKNLVYNIYLNKPVIFVNFTSLQPYTEYSVWSRSFLADGTSSEPSPVYNFTTREAC